ncbi:hypothetical protein B0T11DRAFT_2203 [Plectosphaerella cucumerina]|uniref:Uncharacterized protein n=1 Tax=Plectosphaerella cucumerina TaxID=40658 RepID=A0A8K0TNT9_9PEZI|nr:hypothetical protein B0T11DRAFT_2203 [Plectosphaerella cucumerina]
MKKLKQRLPRFQRPGHHPSIEKNRTWHDPVVEIYENIAGASEAATRTSVRAYDVANRRWYHLEVDAVADEEWMASVVEKHIRAYHKGHRRQPRWNTIKTTLRGTPVAYDTQEEEVVSHQLTESLNYGGKPEDRFPTVQWRDVHDKRYLSKGADHCHWNGKQCVFKRIEFDADVPAFERAIRNREKLIACLESDDGGQAVAGADVYAEMERRFNVVPIHAVVIKDDDPGPWRKGTVAGILMPFAGSSLDALAERGQMSVTEAQLLDLLSGIRELNRFDVCHGDICDWNVALQPSLDLSGRGIGAGRLLLLDLGNVAPDYEGDAKLLGRLFLWCLEHSANLNGDQAVKLRVEEAAFLLKTREDLDLAYEKMSEGALAGGQARAEESVEGEAKTETEAEAAKRGDVGAGAAEKGSSEESPGRRRE